MMEKLNYFFAVTVTSWLLALMIITAEFYSPFKDLLKAVFTHHWIGKIAILIVVFLLVGFLFKEKQSSEKTAYYSAVGSLAVILLFFVFKFLMG